MRWKIRIVSRSLALSGNVHFEVVLARGLLGVFFDFALFVLEPDDTLLVLGTNCDFIGGFDGDFGEIGDRSDLDRAILCDVLREMGPESRTTPDFRSLDSNGEESFGSAMECLVLKASSVSMMSRWTFFEYTPDFASREVGGMWNSRVRLVGVGSLLVSAVDRAAPDMSTFNSGADLSCRS